MGLFRNRGVRSGTHTGFELGTLEDGLLALEQRLALYQGPMIAGAPLIASLESPNNSVVRVDTTVGKFDIELFDALAPTTVANFKKYITTGKFDESFFHKLAGNLVQGGKYKFDDITRLGTITAEPAIPNGFSRSNLAQTLAMLPDTSTTTSSQFIINLTDNIPFNTLNGGYTVFGRVVQGWSVVQQIASLATQDLDQQLTGSNPNPGTFDTVPVTGAYNPGTGPTEATIVKIIDIEITKTNNQNRYYENQFVFPEGFRSSTTIERLDLLNLDTVNTNLFQVIVRYETGDRDSVIFTGSIAPHARFSLKINDFNAPSYNLVRSNVGYSFEIRSTRALSANLNHRDASTTIAESFQMLPRIITGQLQAWNLSGGERGTLYRNYVVFESLTNQKVTVHMLIYPEGGAAPIYSGFPLEAYRRGGFAIHSLPGVPTGKFSVQLSATGPIVASMSQYKLGGGGNTSDGSIALGSIGGGRAEGYLAAARIPTGGETHFEIEFTVGSPAAITVNFEFILSDGTSIAGTPVVMAAGQRHRSYDIHALNPSLPVDAYFSARYFTGNLFTPVAVTYRAEMNGDEMATPFQTITTRSVSFADGYLDPALIPNGMQETISVFNPYASNVNFLYDLYFTFADGTRLPAAAPGVFSLGSHERADHRPQDFANILAKINSNPAFRFYSVEVVSTQFTLPQPVGGVIAQLTRVHNTWGQNLTTIPNLDPRLVVMFLDNPEFHP